MNDESMNASSDLIRWLKMLALPNWARSILAIIMLLVLFSALGLLFWGLINAELEIISSAVAMLTVGLPIGLIVVAIVFGDGGASKLIELTRIVLTQEIPNAILQNLASSSGGARYKASEIVPTLSGCIADYLLTTSDSARDDAESKQVSLEFKLELNVKKANFVVWIPLIYDSSGTASIHNLQEYEHCFTGATMEGYIKNTMPMTDIKSGHLGFVFIKQLGSDFLLNPGDRLYFAQDLAFFVRGLLDVAAKGS